MATLNQQLDDSRLNAIGRLLVLAEPHGLTVQKIKKLTRATKVTKIKDTNDVNEYLNGLFFRVLLSLQPQTTDKISLYYIEGDNAASSMLRMASDKVLLTVELNAKRIHSLHNSYAAESTLRKIAGYLAAAHEEQQELSAKIKNSGITLQSTSRTKAIESVAMGYGVDDIEAQRDNMRNLLKPSW